MQNVVTVASQSPPDVMTSTKPAVQTATAPIQDPFELVLQKTSERLDKKRCENASPGGEQGTKETQKGQNSTTTKAMSETQERKEVQKTESTIEENNEVKDKIADEDENSDVPSIFQRESVVGVQQSIIVPVAETPVEVSAEVSGEAEGNSLPAAIALAENLGSESNKSSTSLVSAMGLPVEAKPENTVEVAVPAQAAQKPTETKEASSPSSTSSELFDDSSTSMESLIQSTNTEAQAIVEGKASQKNVVKDESKTEIQKAEIVQNEVEGKTGDLKNVKVETQKQAQVTATATTSTTNTELIEKTDNQNQSTKETAPPDTPKVTENPISTSTVTTSQLDEPARLAEAPKNEVVAQITNQIDQMVKTNRSSVRMQLYPEELGHIDIQITTTKNGIGVTMIADSASTQDALKSEMNNLKQNMQQAGIQLSDLNIGQGQNSNKQQQFDEKQNYANNAYLSNNNSGTKTIDTHKQVQLQTTAIDYRI